MVKKPYYQKNRLRAPRRKRLGIILVCLGALLLIGGVAAAYFFLGKDKATTQKQMGKTSTGYDVNLNPATDEEKEETEANKETVSKEQAEAGNTPGTTENTTTRQPFITYAGQADNVVEVSGYVLGVFEAGGTCKATFTRDSSTVSGTSKGIEDADHTTCPPISVPMSQFTEKGVWNVVLSYTSKTTNGTSTSRSITIQ